MATITRGFTFAANELVTNTKLHNLMDAGTVSLIDRSDADPANTSFIHIGSSSPGSPYTGLHWFDTSTEVLRRYDGTDFQPVANGIVLTNRSGGNVVKGDPVVIDTGNDTSFDTTTTANNQGVLGVAAETISDTSTGVIIVSGRHVVNVTGSGTRGDYLQTSTTPGAAKASTTQDSGTFARLLVSGSASLLDSVVDAGNSSSQVSSDINDALTGATTPSSSNVFLTENDIPTANPIGGDEANLKIIRGSITAAGAITAGSGFTVAGPVTNTFTITFTDTFASRPSCQATALAAPSTKAAQCQTISTSQLKVYTWTSGVGGSDEAFEFLAIGPE